MVQCPTLPHITLHYLALDWIRLDYVKLHYITLRYITFHYATLLYYMPALHHIASHILHHITSYYITFHYTTLHHMTHTRWELNPSRKTYRTYSLSQQRWGPDKKEHHTVDRCRYVFTPAGRSAACGLNPNVLDKSFTSFQMSYLHTYIHTYGQDDE